MTAASPNSRTRIVVWAGLLLVLVVLLCVLLRPRRPQTFVYADSDQAGALKVLFVGNSLTYCHDMPAMLTSMLRHQDPNRPLKITMIAGPGFTLREHYWAGDLHQALRNKGPWDFVVLQEQGGRPIENPADTERCAHSLDQAIRASGARTLVFIDWLSPPLAWNAGTGLHPIAAKLALPIAPVSDAWWSVSKRRPDISLLEPDNVHPTPAGSYLAACVFFAVITDQSPENLPESLKYTTPDEGERVLVDLPRAMASELQSQAWEYVRTRAAAGQPD